jgi:hypothetical protein
MIGARIDGPRVLRSSLWAFWFYSPIDHVYESRRGAKEAVGIAYAPQEQGYQETLHIRINLNWWISGGGFNGAGREGRLHKCRTTGTEALSIFD